MRIITRAESGLRPPLDPDAVSMMTLPARSLFLHHSVTPVTGDPMADIRLVQSVAFGRGFNDFSYSFAIHPRVPESVFEGRGQQVGAHTEGRNSTTFGVVILGNFETDPLPDHVIHSARWLRWHLLDQGQLLHGVEYQPHKSVYATACPGRHVLDRMDAFRVPWAVSPDDKPPLPPPPSVVVPPPAPAVVVPNYPGLLRKGSTGSGVRSLQARLRERGWVLAVDGDFGPATEAIVRKFQAEKRLLVDGIVGPASWRALWVEPIT